MRAAVANIQNTQPDRFRVIISSRHLFSMSAKDGLLKSRDGLLRCEHFSLTFPKVN